MPARSRYARGLPKASGQSRTAETRRRGGVIRFLLLAFRRSGGAEDVSQAVVMLVALEGIDLVCIRRERHGDRPGTGPRLRIVERCGPLDPVGGNPSKPREA